MIDGDVNLFVSNLQFQDEAIEYEGKLYYFYGVRKDFEKNTYYAMIGEFDGDIFHFVQDFYYYESDSRDDCTKHLLEDKYWNGKSFWEAEKDMTWVDT